MIQENDKLNIPGKYQKMSATELKKEKEKVLADLLSKERVIKQKKVNRTKISFYI